MLLFLDTETTGKYHFDKPSDHPDQPKIVEIAALLCDKHGAEWGSFNVLIDNDIDIPAEASNIHGITREDCTRYGLNASIALNTLVDMAINCTHIVGHNISFDMKMIRSAYGKEEYEKSIFPLKTYYCTMLKSTNICKIPKAKGGGFKWPKLSEAYKFFTGKEVIGAHRAMADVLACKEVYLALKKMEV